MKIFSVVEIMSFSDTPTKARFSSFDSVMENNTLEWRRVLNISCIVRGNLPLF